MYPLEGARDLTVIVVCCHSLQEFPVFLALLFTNTPKRVQQFSLEIVKSCPVCFLFSREDVERRFEGKLSKNMSGSLYEMVSRVMKALVNRKITVPGNFQG